MRIVVNILLAGLMALPTSALGWGKEDHRLLAQQALHEVVPAWGLDDTVEVRPVTRLVAALNRAGLKVSNSKDLALTLYINPLTSWHQIPEEELKARQIRIVDLITAHTNDPDDGRDKGVIARDPKGLPLFDAADQTQPISADQKWMAGVSSQAFRHIEKPPLTFRHLSTTIGYPFGKVGEATRRAGLYYYLGLVALSQGEEYWGWRMLACSFHYIQDLTQPYHSAQLTLPLVGQTLFRSLRLFGQKEWLDAVVHVVGNQHRFYETYLDQITLTPEQVSPAIHEAGGKILPMARGTEAGPEEAGPVELATRLRDRSNAVSGRLQSAVARLSGERLFTDTEFDGEHVPPDNPRDFVIDPADPQSLKAHQEMLKITGQMFALAGQAQRRLVDLFIKESRTPNTTYWLKQVDALRRPTHPPI